MVAVSLKKKALWSLWGLCLSMPFSLVAGEFFGAVIFLAWIVYLASDPGEAIPRSRITWALILFAVFRILSVITSIDPALSSKTLGKLPLLLLVFPMHTLFTRRQMERALMVFIIAVSAAALYGGFRVSFLGLDRARTTYGGYTGLSLQIMTAAILALGFGLGKGRRRWLIVFLAPLTFGLVTCFSRSQWLGAAAGAVVAAALIKPRSLPYIFATMLLLSIVVPEEALFRALETFQSGGDSNRFLVWLGGLRLLRGLPFTGYGPYTFGQVFPEGIWELIPDKNIWNYHNDFLQFLLESGIPGFAALAGLWITAGVAAFRRIKNGCVSSAAAIAAFFALFISSLLNGVITDPMVMPIIAILLAIIGTRPETSLSEGKRILLVRTDRIGDVVLTLPMATALKRAFPGVRIDMAVREYARDVARMAPDVDKVLPYSGNILEDIRRIRGNRYHAAVLVRPELLPAFVLAAARVPLRLGTGYRAWSPPLLNCRLYRHRSNHRHESELNLELLGPLGPLRHRKMR